MKQTCYVIMPFTVRQEHLAIYDNNSDHWKGIYVGLIQPAIDQAGLKCHRDDEDYLSGDIVRRIVKKIEKSDLVLCDLSSNNPNVLFELGWALRANKRVVFIKDDITPRSFDLQNLYTFQYPHRPQLHLMSQYISNLAKCIKDTIESTDDNVTILEGWDMAVNNKPILIKQRCSVDIYYYKQGLTKKEASTISENLRSQGIMSRTLEHDDLDGPDAVFIGSMVEAEDARLVISLIPYEVKYLFRPDYPESEGGDSEGYKIGIGYSAKYNEGRRNRKRSEPVPLSPQQLVAIFDDDHTNTSFHRLLWETTLQGQSDSDS